MDDHLVLVSESLTERIDDRACNTRTQDLRPGLNAIPRPLTQYPTVLTSNFEQPMILRDHLTLSSVGIQRFHWTEGHWFKPCVQDRRCALHRSSTLWWNGYLVVLGFWWWSNIKQFMISIKNSIIFKALYWWLVMCMTVISLHMII